MKKMLSLLLCVAMVSLFGGCGSRQTGYLPNAADFLSANTITGLLNRYETVCCFEKLLQTTVGEEVTRSWQYHQEETGGVVQTSFDKETTLFYNRLLLTTSDDGKEVHYGVYLNESDQPEQLYFKRENIFGEQSGAEITFLDAPNAETFRFRSRFTITPLTEDEYALWDVKSGDEIVGVYTVSKEDLRILKSEVSRVRDGESIALYYASWVYSRPLQLHEMWEEYTGSENRKLLTVRYTDGTEKRYFFPTGVTPELYLDDGHQLFLDESGEIPYVSKPMTDALTLYYL